MSQFISYQFTGQIFLGGLLAAVRDLLRTQGSEWTVDQIAAQFKGAARQKTTILTCLESLEALGIVTNHTESGDSSRWYLAELQKVVD